MDETEREFVRMYARTLLRTGDFVVTALHLMKENTLDVSDVVQAAKMAHHLDVLSDQFSGELAPDDITLNDEPWSSWSFAQQQKILRIFELSFFNLQASDEKAPANAGWFSGKPTEWHPIIVAINAAYEKHKKAHTTVFKDIYNAFAAFLYFDTQNFLEHNVAGSYDLWSSLHKYKYEKDKQANDYTTDEDLYDDDTDYDYDY